MLVVTIFSPYLIIKAYLAKGKEDRIQLFLEGKGYFLLSELDKYLLFILLY
jgi:hypothetical protein